MSESNYLRRMLAVAVALGWAAVPFQAWGQKASERAAGPAAAFSNLPKTNPLPEANGGGSGGARPTPAGYRIGAGDHLQISVWKEPDASVPDVEVRSDGKISLPIIKEVAAQGLTPTELEKILTEKYSHVINEPEVAVLVKEVQSEKVYLVGAVKREGAFLLKSQMTILQVLAEAGGLTDFAKKKKIYVLRTENQKQRRLPFNYEDVIKGEHVEQNVLVLPGDTIVVPQ